MVKTFFQFYLRPQYKKKVADKFFLVQFVYL